MLKNICFVLLLGAIIRGQIVTVKGDDGRNAQTNREFSQHEIRGQAVSGLHPCILMSAYKQDWGVEVGLIALTNFSEHAWLKPINRVGSKLQLWLSSGQEISSTNVDVLNAMRLPSETSVSNVLRGVQWSRRGLQWLPTEIGKLSACADFNLHSAFDVPFTNSVVLQITPLIYKVNTDETTAHLVEFPPIKLKLLPNGDVQKLELKE